MKLSPVSQPIQANQPTRIDHQKSLDEITEAEYNNALYRFNQSYQVQPNDCWLWTGYKFSYKTPSKPCQLNFIYGQFAWCDLGKRSMRAHRAAWILHYGDIPAGLQVLHCCDTPLCVNPLHLRLGTHQDNMNDMKQRGRAAIGVNNASYRYPEKRPKGSKHGMAKLTEETVKLIKQDCLTDLTNQVIAKKYIINPGTVSFIRRGLQWQHVNV